MRANQIVLSNCRDTIDQQLKSIDTYANNLATNTDVRSLLRDNGPFVETTPWKIWKTWKSIQQNYYYANEYIAATYVYFKGLDIIITPNAAYIKPVIFYKYFSSLTDLSYEVWRAEFLVKRHIRTISTSMEATINGNNTQIIPYLHSLPNDVPINKGKIILFLDEARLHALFKEFAEQQGFVFIINDVGQVVTSFGQDIDMAITVILNESSGMQSFKKTISGQEVMVSRVRSDHAKWTIYAGIPLTAALRQVNLIKQIIFVTVALIIFLGLGIIAIVTEYNYRPIRKIMDTIGKQNDNQEKSQYKSYNDIQESISRIISENNDLNKIVDEQKPIITGTLISKLLDGGFSDEKVIESSLGDIQLKLQGYFYSVVIVKFHKKDETIEKSSFLEIVHAKTVVRNVLQQVLTNTVTHDLDQDSIVVVLANSEASSLDSVDAVKATIAIISQTLDANATKEYTITVGSPYASLIEVAHSYNEARFIMGFAQSVDYERILYYQNMNLSEYTYHYSSQIERDMVNNIKDAHFKHVDAILWTIYSANFVNNRISPLMKQQLLADMRSTLIQLMVDIQGDMHDEKMNREFELLFNTHEVPAFFDIYKQLSQMIGDECQNKRNNRNQELLISMVQYIQRQYSDPSLSLTSLSEEFHLTQSYISRFFKETTGEHFFGYLEKIRMERASQLLKNSSVGIENVAKLTGYNDAHVFSRAFKRYYSFSPSEYRKTT